MKTTFKSLESLGFTYKKSTGMSDSEAYIETAEGYMTLTKDSNDDFRLTIDCYYLGQPLNTIKKVKEVAKYLYNLNL